MDEPDIYLHSDLQRQLVHLLRETSSDVLLATHSTEIIAEAESDELVLVNKKWRSAQRVKSPQQLQDVFGLLGSNLNPVLTQLAKTKKALFVEGKDFSIIAGLARKLGFSGVANRSGFAVVQAEGFNPSRVRDFAEGMESTLGGKIERAVVFDRDYRCDEEVERIKADLGLHASLVHIHDRKELENHLLVPSSIRRAIDSRLKDRQRRGSEVAEFYECAEALLLELTDQIKSEVFGQFVAHGLKAKLDIKSGLDCATANAQLHNEFEAKWSDPEMRLRLVPGKQVLSMLNSRLQEKYKVTMTPTSIITAMSKEEVTADMQKWIGLLAKW